MAKNEEKRTNEAAPDAQKSRAVARGAESITYVALTLVVLVLLNVAGQFLFFRLDMTRNKLYSLSQASERLVSDLDEDMTITAYFTSDLPPPFNATEHYVRNLLSEYEAASNGRIHLRFVNPDDEEEAEAADEAGIVEEPVRRLEGNSFTMMQARRGLVIEHLGDRQVIPAIRDTRGLEYSITQAIRLLVREPLPVGVMQGHGGLSPSEGLTTLRSTLEHYELREVDVSEEIDSDLSALLIVNPTEELSEVELRRINQYVMRGGSLGVFGGSMNVTLQGGPPSAAGVDTGINRLLQGWGVQVGEGIVADADCTQVPMRTPIGIPIPVAYPPAPIVTFDRETQEHPVAFRLPQAIFWFTSPIEIADRFHELNGTILARSGERASWVMTGDSVPLQPRDPREWRIDGPEGPHTLMAALHGQLPSAFEAGEGDDAIEAPAQSEGEVRVLVSGSGSLLRDEFLPQQGQQVRGSGAALAFNAVDWLAGDADLIAIRAKNIEDPALDLMQRMGTSIEEAAVAEREGDEEELRSAIERHNEAFEELESKQTLTQWGITIGLPLLVLFFGLGRWQLRRNKRANLEELRERLSKKKKAKKAT